MAGFVDGCQVLCLQLRALTSARGDGGKSGLFVCVVFLLFTGLMFLCFGSQTQLIMFPLLLPGFPNVFVERWWFYRKCKWTPKARHCGRDLILLILVSWSVESFSMPTFLTSATVSWERIWRFVTARRETHGRAVSIR